MREQVEYDKVALQWLTRISAGGTPNTDNTEYWYGDIPWIGSGEVNQGKISEPTEWITAKGLHESSTKLFDEDTVVVALAGQGKTKGMAGILQRSAAVNQSLAGIVSRGKHITPEYLFYCLKRDYQKLRGLAGEGRSGITLSDLKEWEIPLPSTEKQEDIADFLDRRTARIDALVTKQKRLLDLLIEKRQAIISRLITDGQDQNTTTKDSEISWLDSIPSHWRTATLKYVAEVRTGIAKGKTRDAEKLRNIPYLRVANVQDGYLNLEEIKELEITEQEINQYALQDGDVLMNEGGDFDKLGRGTVWRGQIKPCVHQNHVFCVRPHDVDDSEWISKLTESSYLKHYFIMNAKQSTNLASISAGNIGGAPLIWPPRDERKEILQAIREKTSRIDELKECVNRSIDLLTEKRQALITAAVTGQIDVTEERDETHAIHR